MCLVASILPRKRSKPTSICEVAFGVRPYAMDQELTKNFDKLMNGDPPMR